MSDLSSEPRIRPLERSDLSELVRLCGAHAEYEQSSFDAAGKEEAFDALFFSGSPRIHCLVAATTSSPGDPLLGYTTFSREISTWTAAEFLHMDCLYLEPDARGRGIGAALLDRVVRFAAAAGCSEVQWQSPHWNHRAARFYHRHGARSLPKLRFFLPSGETLPPLGD